MITQNLLLHGNFLYKVVTQTFLVDEKTIWGPLVADIDIYVPLISQKILRIPFWVEFNLLGVLTVITCHLLFKS